MYGKIHLKTALRISTVLVKLNEISNVIITFIHGKNQKQRIQISWISIDSYTPSIRHKTYNFWFSIFLEIQAITSSNNFCFPQHKNYQT